MTTDAELLDADRRVAMVSGASRGIGEAIAHKLLDDGFRLSLGVRDVAATQEKFAAADDDTLLVTHYDATDPATADDWVDRTVQHFGALDALINNAGIWHQVNFETGDEGLLDELWQVNVKVQGKDSILQVLHVSYVGFFPHNRWFNGTHLFDCYMQRL